MNPPYCSGNGGRLRHRHHRLTHRPQIPRCRCRPPGLARPTRTNVLLLRQAHHRPEVHPKIGVPMVKSSKTPAIRIK